MSAQQIQADPPVEPHSLEAEQAIIGSTMVDSTIYEQIRPFVKADDFYAWTHGTIFSIIADLASKNLPTGKIAVAERLKTLDKLEQVGGLSYLSALMDTVQSVASATYYSRIVREKATLRRLIDFGRRAQQAGFTGEGDVTNAVAGIERELRAITEGAETRFGSTMAELGARYRELREGASLLTFSTPWPLLDDLTGGFAGGELVIWGADPKVGKSVLINQLAYWTAQKYGQTLLYATEMGDMPTYMRLVTLLSGVAVRRQRNPHKLNEWELEKMEQAIEALNRVPLRLFDSMPMPSTDDIRSQAVKLHRDNPIAAIVVDHVGYLADVENGERGSTMHQRQDRALRNLKRIAKELNVPVHCVFHFSRAPSDASGSNKVPRPSAKRLRDGGNAEGHATSIIFPYREDLGSPNGELILDRAREGNSNKSVPMHFIGHRAVWLQTDQDRAWFEDPIAPPQSLFEKSPGDDERAAMDRIIFDH